MKYDFDRVIDRKNTSSMKWDFLSKYFGEENILPMWVADMDFEAPAPVIEAVRKRADHGIYGYTGWPKSCLEAITGWMEKRHGWKIDREWLSFSPGVVPAIAIAVLAYTQPGDKIIIQSPVYHPFFSTVENNGRQLVENRLKFEEGRYVMDFEELERSFDPRVKMVVLCSPHNPVGRVWTREELKRFGEICMKHDVILVSDEIHSDIIYKGHKHVPAATVYPELAEKTITCIAPSKTFNIAGLSTSAVIIPNKRLREQFNNMAQNLGIELGNVFGIAAMEAAYSRGEEWLDQLLEYLEGNIEFLIDYLGEKIPSIKAVRPEGTYLVWLDCRGLDMNQEELNDFMIKKAGIGLNNGIAFGGSGEGFMRMNIACPRSILQEGLKRIEKVLEM